MNKKTFSLQILSGAMKALKLKLGTHMDSVLLYCLYQNQGRGLILLSYIPW